MRNFKSHFWYNKRQRNGILFLLIIIFILQLIYFFVDFSQSKTVIPNNQLITNFQMQIDSLKKVKQEKSATHIYPFNPNFITDYKGYILGMNLSEIDKLHKFRASGKFINSTRQFQLVTGVSDSLLNQIAPYFKFPKFRNDKKQIAVTKNIIHEEIKHGDLNKVSENELIRINGIGKKLAKRIIAYRNLLQGFSFNNQLYEVYYLEKEVADKVLKIYRVIEKPHIQKLNINTAKFKEILGVPYINYELTKKIMNYKDQNGDLSTLEDLKKIDSFPVEKYDRITLYLTVN